MNKLGGAKNKADFWGFCEGLSWRSGG